VAETEVEIPIEAPISAVWRLLTDLEALGLCLPFVEKTERLKDEGSRWFIKSPMRSITRTPHLDTAIESKVLEAQLSISGEGSNLKIMLRFLLNAVSKRETMLTLEGEINAKGLLRRILSPMISTQVDVQMEAFVQKIKEKIEIETLKRDKLLERP